MLRAKVTVFLDLHRKNRQLERMLAREQAQFAELAARLSAIERELAAGTRPDAAELRHQVRRWRSCCGEMRRGRTP